MFTKGLSLLSFNTVFRFSVLLLMLLTVNSSHSAVTKNEVDDLNLIISQFVGGQPNALFIMDLSGSMGRTFGGSQVGRWTPSDDGGTVTDCEVGICGGVGECSSRVQRAAASHCAENTANLSVCGSKFCTESGVCGEQEQFDRFLECVEANNPGFTTSTKAKCIYEEICINPTLTLCPVESSATPSSCDTFAKRAHAASAIEAAARLTTCSSDPVCDPVLFGLTSSDFSCSTSEEYGVFKSCMSEVQPIDVNREENCTAMDSEGNLVNEDCIGQPRYGSSRLDVTLSVIFDLLDADNSLDDALCEDDGNASPNFLFDGESSIISCKDYMYTPFRNVHQIVRDHGSPPQNRRLPIAQNSGSDRLISYLTDNDAEELNIRIRPLTYSGVGNWAGCTDNKTFQIAQGGFAGASEASFRNVWRFFRDVEPLGGTPLAYVLGFDDSNRAGGGQGNVVNDDALGVYRVELQTDPAIECRPEFVIILTDGEDSCAGDCSATPSSCTGATTTNANRRSTLQAVNNLRTYYVRNPVRNRGQDYKKEIMTFVIGLGIPEENERARRTINAMAMLGGTHNEGLIRHTDPDGFTLGTVNINDIFPSSSEFDVFKSLARADGIDSQNPSSAHMDGCRIGQESETGVCSLGGKSVFDNVFFNTGDPLPDELRTLDGFAFFPQNAEELRNAFEQIFGFIDTFTTAGVSPSAPQSSSSVALRDRIFLSILTPITDQRLWQGRLALYGFVDDPENAGNRIVVRDPGGADLTDIDSTETLINQYGIFNPVDGTLVREKAQQFHWEAGKSLAERDLAAEPRNIVTVNPDFSEDGTAVDTSSFGTIRYTGGTTAFDTTLAPDTFGISDSDVVNPLPSYCTAEPPVGYADCNSEEFSCNTDITSDECRTCVKNCLRDRIVDFMSGNTEIRPIGDPLGSPHISGTTDSEAESMGTNCPNDSDGSGSFDTCSVRLGDIFHSDPVVVGSPSALFFDTGFPAFARAYRNRSSAVYVGSNSGGFHSFHAGEFVNAGPGNPKKNPFTGATVEVPFFDSGTGWEMFFYIPPTFLPDSIAPESPINKDPESHLHDTFPEIAFTPDYRFGDLKTFVVDNLVHRAFFDGSPLIFDAFIDGYDNNISDNSEFCPVETGPAQADGKINECGKEWHTLAVSGYRNGGGAYTALNITNPKCVVDGSSTKCTSVEQFAAGSANFNGSGAEYPEHLWTVFDRDFGNTWSNPAPGRVRMKTKNDDGDVLVDRWLLFVGGGLDPLITDPSDGVDFGNGFYAIDAATGKIVYKFHPLNPVPSNIPNNSIRQSMQCDVASTPGVFDLNNDGYVDIAYVGDTCGRLWRFDISKPIQDTGNNVSETGIDGNAVIEAQNWHASIALCANTAGECGTTESPEIPQNNIQSIYFAPTVALDSLGRRHVIFSTGSRRDPSNIELFGKLFNFIDPYQPAFITGGEDASPVTVPMKTESDFSDGQIIEIVSQGDTGDGQAEQFTTQGGNAVNNQGEFIVIFPDNVDEPSGEKGVGTPVVINRVLVFTSFAPDAGIDGNPCTNKAGVGRVFALDYLSGEPALSRIPGASAMLGGTDDQQRSAAGLTVSEGIPSPARLTFGSRGSVIMTVAFAGGPTVGGAQFLVWDLPPFPSRTQTLFWEEIM